MNEDPRWCSECGERDPDEMGICADCIVLDADADEFLGTASYEEAFADS